MSWIVAIALALSGFAGLSLAMNKHQRSVFGQTLPDQQSRLYRRVGWALIAACTAVCIVAFDWSFGLVALCGVATLASISVILLLTFQPEKLPLLCPVPVRIEKQSSD